jgi:hypothetical protein
VLPTLLGQLLGVWLITQPTNGVEQASLWRLAARWWAIIGGGLMLGLTVGRDVLPLPGISRTTGETALLVSLLELPATVLLLAWIATVATPEFRRTLSRLTLAAGVLIGLPLITLPLSRLTWGLHNTWSIVAATGLYGAAAVSVTVMATVTLARWAMQQAAPGPRPSVVAAT